MGSVLGKVLKITVSDDGMLLGVTLGDEGITVGIMVGVDGSRRNSKFGSPVTMNNILSQLSSSKTFLSNDNLMVNKRNSSKNIAKHSISHH